MKKAILVVSFGTSYLETLAKTITVVEQKIQSHFSEYQVYRAFTSGKIIKKLRERDHLVIDTVPEAMNQLILQGYQEVIVQPTYVMNGIEYDLMRAQLKPFEQKIPVIRYGEPMLAQEQDYSAVIEAMMLELENYYEPDTALVLMGHGTEHQANQVYRILNQKFKETGYSNVIVGTIEAAPDLEEVIGAVKHKRYQRLVLVPLMIVAGDHAVNDMAGSDEESWRSVFLDQGYEVICYMKGLGEYPLIQQLFIEHIKQAQLC